MIELGGVGKRFGDSWAVRGVSLTVGEGELVAVVGESGSGKTTILRMINRLVEADEGTVRVGGVDVTAGSAVSLRRSIGYVIQQVGLLPHLSIADNVAMVPTLLGWDAGKKAERVNELLALVGLPGAGAKFPEQLSGGERQRIGVARALAARPRLLLLDEPFGALDPITRVALQAEVKRIHVELGLTSVLVTHDLVEALTMADRIAVMYRSELRQVGTPAELLARPADDYVARLIGMARRQKEQLAEVGA
jgi:osmoprotectant transport system ATP-binding protein